MLQPVSHQEFFSSPAGVEYEERFLPATAAAYPQFNNEELRTKIACWQTANFNPDTGFCTIYRGVDDARKQIALETGVIASRAVMAFGQGDMELAINSLREAAEGRAPDHAKDYAKPLVEASQHYIDNPEAHMTSLMDFFQDDHDEGLLLLSADPPDHIQSELHRTADLLQTAVSLGSSAYELAARQAGSDDTPPPDFLFSKDTLLNTSLFFTTDFDLFKRWRYDHILQVDFRPGSLATAPEIAHVADEGYTIVGNNGVGQLSEVEWYVLGAAKASDDVRISLVTRDA